MKIRLFLPLLFAFSLSALAQVPSTTTLQQVTFPCLLQGCPSPITIPPPMLTDGEIFSYTTGIRFFGPQTFFGTLTFRGITFPDFTGMVTEATGPPVFLSHYEALDGTASGGQIAVHEYIRERCLHGCVQFNIPPSFLTLADDLLAIEPAMFTSGSVSAGQVGIAVASATDTDVLLSTTDPTMSLTVPSNVLIPAGTLYAPFAITANPVDVQTVALVTATFPDGGSQAIAVTVEPPPPPPPPPCIDDCGDD